MSNILVSDVQKQEPGSELIELFEVEISSGEYIYLHSGLTENLDYVRFRDRTNSATIRSYTPMPIEMTGVESNSDGAQNRPTLVIANVSTAFRDLLDGFTNEDLIGKRVYKRQTLRKYLYGEELDTNPPFEFPIKAFIIDRLVNENPLSVEFEISSPFDLSGIQLPNRVVVGKYCSWIYQGAATGKGGCIWPSNSIINIDNGSGTLLPHKAYYTSNDEPIVSAAAISGGWLVGTTYAQNVYVSDSGSYWYSKQADNLGNTPGADSVWWGRARVGAVWSGAGVSYTNESYVEYNNTAWKAKTAHISTSGNAPYVGSRLWERADICGKELSSCKARFQFVPVDNTESYSAPAVRRNTSNELPFGAFPGALKFR